MDLAPGRTRKVSVTLMPKPRGGPAPRNRQRAARPGGDPAGAARRPREADPQALLYAQDVARLNRLRKTYERLVPEGLDPFAPVPEPRICEATILFADLRGFTGVAEQLEGDPARILALLNQHFDAAVTAILRCGGIVEKFLGDGVFATFGARGEDADHAAHALAASIAVVNASIRLNRMRARTGDFPTQGGVALGPAPREAGDLTLQAGVGLCSGRVVVGALGPPDRFEIAVLGDAVNVASRLACQAKPSEVLVAHSTYLAVAATVAADFFGDRPVRGRVGSIAVHRINLARA